MFCINCGKQIDEDAQFCANCGTKLKKDTTNQTAIPIKDIVPTVVSETAEEKIYTEQVPESVDMSTNVPPINDLETEQEVAVVESKAKQDTEASMRTSASDTVLRKLIGKNADYYMSAFENVKQGQKTKFMWSSLLFPIYFVLYRNCMPIFKSKYMIPAVLSYVAGPIVMMIGALLPSFELTTVFTLIGSSMIGIGLLWATVVGIQLGFKFPKLYYEYLLNLIKEKHITEQNVDSFVPKYAGVNWKLPVIFMAVIIVISVLSATVSSAGLLMGVSSMGDDFDYKSDDITYTADDTAKYFSDTEYFINFGFDPPEYGPSIIFYPDGTFTLYDNYYSGIEVIDGMYELSATGINIIGENYYFTFIGPDIQICGDYSNLVGFKFSNELTHSDEGNFNALAYNQEENQGLFEPYADQSYIGYEEARSILLYYLDLKYGFPEDEYEIYASEDEAGYVFEVYNWNVSSTSNNLGIYLVEHGTGNVYTYAIYVFDPEGALEFSPDWV